MLDDAALLRRYAATHAEDAFAELVRRHLDGVYSAALRRVGGDTHLAEDVAQHVFVALARQARALAEHPVLTGWLYTTTRNEAANVVRHERRRKAREQEAHAMHDLLVNPSASADWSRIAPVLDRLVDGLREPDRTAVLLRFVERRPFADIGTTLRVSEDAARMRVERALEKLRTGLTRHGITSTAAALGLALTNNAVLAAPAGLAANITGAALAISAPTLGTTLLNALEFMSTTKTLLGATALLALIAALGTAGYQTAAHRAAAAELTAATRDYDAMMTRRRAEELELQRAENELVQLKQAVADAQAKSAADAAAAAERARLAAEPPWDPQAAGKAFVARHPDVKAALTAYGRARARFRFAKFYETAHLTPDQIEKLELLMCDGSGMGTDGPEESKELSLPVGDDLNPEEHYRKLRELLGEETLKALQRYEDREDVRETTVQVAAALWFTDTPLTTEQSDQLAQVLAGNRREWKEGNTWHREGFDFDAVIAKAGAFLAPAQLAVIDGLKADQQYTAAINRKTLAGEPLAPRPGEKTTE
jgi:RNA polymerase sigma factor (sigma-70 family)